MLPPLICPTAKVRSSWLKPRLVRPEAVRAEEEVHTAEERRAEWGLLVPAEVDRNRKIWEAVGWEAGLDHPEWEAAARAIPVRESEVARRQVERTHVKDLESAARSPQALGEEGRRVVLSKAAADKSAEAHSSADEQGVGPQTGASELKHSAVSLLHQHRCLATTTRLSLVVRVCHGGAQERPFASQSVLSVTLDLK